MKKIELDELVYQTEVYSVVVANDSYREKYKHWVPTEDGFEVNYFIVNKHTNIVEHGYSTLPLAVKAANVYTDTLISLEQQAKERAKEKQTNDNIIEYPTRDKTH